MDIREIIQPKICEAAHPQNLLTEALAAAEKDRIIVTSGPFKDFQGEVIEVSGERNKLKALLSIFGRETPVELEFSQINKQN